MTGSRFVFRMPSGEEVGRAENPSELAKAIEKVPLESLEYHHKNRHFTPWLKDHRYVKLAENLEKETSSGERLRGNLIKAVKKEIR